MKGARGGFTRQTKALARLRVQLEERVDNRAQFVGSMIGLKVKGGIVTNQHGITFFVREKIPKHELNSRERIPSRFQVGDEHIPTDVMVWPAMAEQASSAAIISDGATQGTLSCFAKSPAGYFGVSCGHCLVGADGNPATTTPVSVFDNEQLRFVTVGQSVYLGFSPGTGTRDSFGYLDCGIFDLQDASLAARARAGTSLLCVKDMHTLVGHELTGISALNAPAGITDYVRRAKVIGVEARALDEYSDVILSVDAPGTYHGDSGMLWLTSDGKAAAIHARGQIMGSSTGSRLTTAVFAARVCDRLGIEFIA